MGEVLTVSDLSKSFTLHLQGGTTIPVFENLSFTASAGEALAITGPSGIGKSSLLKLIYGTYKAEAGAIRVNHDDTWIDIVSAPSRHLLGIRKLTIGYVSQFLRVIPRVPTLNVVAEPLIERGADEAGALARARELLERLRIPENLWSLSPVTFSGGEQQRVNIARGFCAPYPILLLDEPTASLDAENRRTVLDLAREARDAGAALLGIFHDEAEREAVCTRALDIGAFKGTVDA